MLLKFFNLKNFVDGGNVLLSVFVLICVCVLLLMIFVCVFVFGDVVVRDLIKFRKFMIGNGELMCVRGECVKYSWGSYARAYSRMKELSMFLYWERKWLVIMV